MTPAQLAGQRIWMPGIVPGTEWAAYYDDLAAAFGLTIEVTGPDFGTEPLLDTIAESPSLATFVGEQTRWSGPPSTACGASPCGTRHRSTRTRSSGTATTRTRHSPRCAATSAPGGPAAPAPARGRRRGRSDPGSVASENRQPRAVAGGRVGP